MLVFNGYLFSICYAFLCLGIALVVYKLGVPKKYTRKLVHILVGFEWVILYHYFGSSFHFLLVCLFFLGVLYLAYRFRLMPMISSDGENAPGTVYYAVAMTGVSTVALFVPDLMVPFGIGIMCTSVGDGFAGVIGQLLSKVSPRIFRNKTLFGTLAGFAFSFLSAYIISHIYNFPLSVGLCLLIALLSSELELFTGAGLDNITITWGVTAFTYFAVNYPFAAHYYLPIFVTPAIIAFAYHKKALTLGGIIAAVIVDLMISIPLGNLGFSVLVFFFLGSIVIDKIKRRIKERRGFVDEEAKGDCRDHMQVLANGLVAALLALTYLFSRRTMLLVAFTAAMAEAFADTVASGLGILSKNTFDPFRMRRCESGISGGMSPLGTVCSLLAAVIVALIPLLFGAYGFLEFVFAASAAFLGAVFDSLLGSLVQAKNKCRVCGKITEKDSHCGESTVHFCGISVIDNDAVNLFSGLFSAIVAMLLCLI